MSSPVGLGPIAPQFILSLPGVENLVQRAPAQPRTDTQKVDAAKTTEPQRSPGAEAAADMRRREFSNDIRQNQDLVGALRHLSVAPTPEGLLRVSGCAGQCPELFAALVQAVTTAAMTLGKSKGAIENMGTAMQDFSTAAKLRSTDLADMAYLMARIILLTQNNERTEAMEALRNSLNQAKDQLTRLLRLRNHQGHGGKVDPRRHRRHGHDSEAGRDDSDEDAETSSKTGEPTGGDATSGDRPGSLDRRIHALDDAVFALETRVATQQVTQTQGDLLNVILVMVEQALGLARQGGSAQGAKPARQAVPSRR